MGEFDSARKRIMVDFDGVIHQNDHWNWNNGECTGKPIPGANESICNLIGMGWEVVIFTARDQRSIITDVEPWLKKNGFRDAMCGNKWVRPLRVTNIKEPAQFYIDDRAYRFTNWDDVTRLVS